MLPYSYSDPSGYSMGTELGGLGQPNPMLGYATGGFTPPIAAPQAPLSFGKPATGASTAPVQDGNVKSGNFLSGFANLADGLSGLGKLYIGLKSLGIAKDQLAFSKEAFTTNLASQKKSYNTSLEDRIRSRYVTEGRSSSEADAYLTKNMM